jgi:putative ABC transport system permease protein
VSDGYLTAIGARLLDRREFAAADATRSIPAIVISHTVARRYFGEGRAIGQLVDWHVDEGLAVQTQVVGVVEDVRNQSPQREARPEIFVDYRRLLVLLEGWGRSTQRRDAAALGFLSFAIRTRGDPASAAPMVGQIVRAVDPNAGIDAILPMDRLVASSVTRQRFYAVMVGVFAMTRAFLRRLGSRRARLRRDAAHAGIGIRMALGAQRARCWGPFPQGHAPDLIALTHHAAAGTRFLEACCSVSLPLTDSVYGGVGDIVPWWRLRPTCLLRPRDKVDPMVASVAVAIMSPLQGAG